jgi:hypothetical protein
LRFSFLFGHDRFGKPSRTFRNMGRNFFAKEGSVRTELIAMRSPVGTLRPSGQCRGSNRGSERRKYMRESFTALMADHMHTREMQICDLSIKTNPEPEGPTQRPDIWAHRYYMGLAKKESVLDRGCSTYGNPSTLYSAAKHAQRDILVRLQTLTARQKIFGT